MNTTATKFYVLNDTDGILANPEPMSFDEATSFMLQFVARYAQQGYYASSSGRIPVSELRLTLLSEDEVMDGGAR